MNRSWLNWGLNDAAGDMEQKKVEGGESRFDFDVLLDGIGWTAPIDGNVLVVEAPNSVVFGNEQWVAHCGLFNLGELRELSTGCYH